MLFNNVRNNSRERFSEIFVNLSHIESIEPKTPTELTQPHVKIQRGLYYVHLYSTLEKTINEVVEQTLLIIKSQNIKNQHFESAFNVITLKPKMQSFKECGYKDFYKKSIAVFEGIDSDEIFEIDNKLFSMSLQNVWFDTIQDVLKSFGVPVLVVDPRVSCTVDEIVDKRNSVAHGRETPLIVGERHRANVLRGKTVEIQLVTDMFIDKFEQFISDQTYIRPCFRATYSSS